MLKVQTASRLKDYLSNGKIEFSSVPEGLSIDYDLSDDELLSLVELEYGQVTNQPVVELFTVICKNAVKLAIKHAKELQNEKV